MIPKNRVKSELIQCVDALRALGPRSTLEQIDSALDDAVFHLRELKGTKHCDPNRIEVLENLKRRAMVLLEEHEQTSREKGSLG